MKAAWLAVILLAGCATPIPDAPDACPFTYPDGTPVACGEQMLSQADSGRPSLDTGWRCTRHVEDMGNTYQRYVHADGRVAVHLESYPNKQDAHRFVRVAAVAPGGGANWVFPWQEDLFFVLPSEALADAEAIYVYMRELRMFRLDADGWNAIPSTATVGVFNHEDWYVLHDPSTGAGVSMMVPQDDPERLDRWDVDEVEADVDGIRYIVSDYSPGLRGDFDRTVEQRQPLSAPCYAALA